MMEVCRRAGDFIISSAHHPNSSAVQQPPSTSLVANFVPTSNVNAVTLTFNNQVQRLVREHRTAPTGYENLVSIKSVIMCSVDCKNFLFQHKSISRKGFVFF